MGEKGKGEEEVVVAEEVFSDDRERSVLRQSLYYSYMQIREALI